MLDLHNHIIKDGTGLTGQMGRFFRLYSLMQPKMASFLRLLSTKNQINRFSDWHYLNLAVTDSTEPVNGVDYIHPVVTPAVDYAVAVICKSLLPDGEVKFEFVPDSEQDADAARQATEMVKTMLNQANDPYPLLHDWAMDACLHKNGLVLVSPHREPFTNYKEITGTMDELRQFEIVAAERGITALRTSRRRIGINPELVQQQVSTPELQAEIAQLDAETAAEDLENVLDASAIYRCRYKLTGYKTRIKFYPIAQHYWICDPTVVNIQDQPFCGFYDPMTIQECSEKYPDIDVELMNEYGEFSNLGAYQAGSLLNNLALHARDSVPINGLPVQGTASLEREARQITVVTVWDRYDIDGDGELELVEIVYSGRYIIHAKEVEFIPVANMCPKPLSQNFYGYSIAERTVPMQEYATALSRAELQMAMYASTPRLGVNPEFVDLEQMQDGESSIFILDRKFDPTQHVWEPQPLQGNLGYVTDAMARMQQDMGAMLGMTSAQDIFNPQVMSAGNSALKLQLAMGPNQLIQDNVAKNCANGLKELIYLTWRTLLQYGDDYGVKKLAMESSSTVQEFIDFRKLEDLDFVDRKNIHIELALGMLSEENKLQRQALIIQTQQGFASTVTALQTTQMLTPEMFNKARRPFEDTLYTLGIKNCDEYLPTMEEIMAAMEAASIAQQSSPPNADEQAKQAKADLDRAKAQEIAMDITGQSAERQLEAAALLQSGKAINY